jgi:multidrug efflux pump subunit AcrA (membrane-fusion protein)
LEKRAKKIIIGVAAAILLVLFVLVVIRIIGSKLFAKEETPPIEKDPVSIVEVKRDLIRKTLFYTGDLHAEKEVMVYSLVPGRVIRYNFNEGDTIRKGATLAVLERTETWDKFKPVIVEAPISGTIALNYLDVGELATTQTPLSLIVGGGGIRVMIKVPDVELGLIKEGMKAELNVPIAPGRIFHGTVERKSPVIERTTRTAQVEMFFKNGDGSLLAGMFGDVTIIVEEKEEALAIPFDAILFENEGMSGPFCFVIEDEKAIKRPLTLGIVESKKVEVVSGLEAGEIVADLGKENLEDGSEVLIIESP